MKLMTGKEPAFEMCPGLLETRFYAAYGIPAFAYGPGFLTVSHGPNEFVPIRNIAECAAMGYAVCRTLWSAKRRRPTPAATPMVRRQNS
jgi:acetylornithine deacetylase/succinyl-diaminopimelate desuccinylase-like protein